MNKYAIIIALAMFQLSAFSQDLLTKYKNGTIHLVPDSEYAQDNNWNEVFRSYYDTLYNKPMGARKSLILLPDGSVLVNHAYRDYHTHFSPNGKFIKEFSLEKAGHKAVEGVLDNTTLFTRLDNMGKMTCTDLNGRYKKTLTLDYMTKDIIALNNGKFAVVGWVIWAEKFRTFVSIIDYDTNEEKVIWDCFTDRTTSSSGKAINKRKPYNYTIKLKDGSLVSCSTMPYSKRTGRGIPPQITSINDELIIAVPNTGEIFTYDLEGNLQSKSEINWPNSQITIEEQKTIQQKAITRYKSYIQSGHERVKDNVEAYETMVSQMEDDLAKIDTPISKPSFSTILKDSDGNILFFEIPKNKGANVFHVWVYDNGGEFATKCTFVCDDYELTINPSKMVFHNGYIYSLQVLKNAKGNPLRLVRFKTEI